MVSINSASWQSMHSLLGTNGGGPIFALNAAADPTFIPNSQVAIKHTWPNVKNRRIFMAVIKMPKYASSNYATVADCYALLALLENPMFLAKKKNADPSRAGVNEKQGYY